MKTWIFTYTEDNGLSYNRMTTEAETYSKAYINVLLKIAMGGMITRGRQIKPRGRRIKQRYRIAKKIIKHVF